MSGIVVPPPISQADIDAIKALIPTIATTMPLPEAVTPTPGSDGNVASGAGHQHPRLTSVHPVTTDASGLRAITFAFPFANKPGFVYGVENNPGATVDVVSYQQDGSNNYIGATVRCTKRTAGVNSTTVSVVGIPVLSGTTASTADTPQPNQAISVTFIKANT